MTISTDMKKNKKNKKNNIKRNGSLQDLCYDSITSSMQTAPPLIQEMIMGETSKRMKDQMIAEAYDIARERAIHDICDELHPLITEIMQDIIMTMTENGRNRKSFRDEYHKLSHPDILECAIKVSEDVIQTMESHYIYRAFELEGRAGLGNYDSDREYESDNSDENSRQEFYPDQDVSDIDDYS